MVQRQPSYGLNAPLQQVFPSPVVGNRAPTTADKRYEIGQIWVDKSSGQVYALASVVNNSATWSVLGPGASDVDTLTGDTGGALSPTAGNINILGGTGLTVAGAGSTLTINQDTGQFPVTQYVVDAGGAADYTTIQSALDAIGAGNDGFIWVRPGTYTEDLTFPANIDVTIMTGGDEFAGAAHLIGMHTPPDAGNVIFWRIKLTSTSHIFNSASAGTANLLLAHNGYDIDGYLFNCPNWTSSGSFTVWNAADRDSTSSGIINNTGGAAVYLFQSSLGVGNTNAMVISGATLIQSLNIGCPATFGGGSDSSIYASNFTDELTFSSTATADIHDTYHSTGSDPCLTLSMSGGMKLFNMTVESSNDPAIDGAGAGTVTIEGINFLSNSNISSSLTLSRGATRGGTSFATTFDTDVAAAGLTISATDIDADGTDANIPVTVTPKGTGTLTVDSGGVSVTAGDIINSHSDAGTDVTIEVTNSDNTNAASRAGFEAAVGGTSSGDPYVNFLISGGQAFTIGIDNSSTNDDFVISDAAALGTANRISIDGSSGNVSVPTSDLDVTRAGGAGTAVQASIVNSDNTNADSPAQLNVTSGGTSGGDAFAAFSLSGGQAFSLGVDNSTTNDDFVISDNAVPGTNNRISIDGSSGIVSIPTTDLTVTRAGGASTAVVASVVNTDNANADSPAQVTIESGGTSGGDAFALMQINGGQAFSVGIDNSATNDDFVISDNAAPGTNNRISIDGSSGDVSVPTSDLSVTRAGGAGVAVVASVINTDNTNADSPAQVTIESGGTSGGDAFALMQINGGQAYSIGIDNSTTNDDFVISDNTAPGTNDRLVIDGSSGDTSITGNLSLPTAATQLGVEGGAVTDFIGQATLSSGTVTVANTNIAAGDRILCTRSDINGSTALGILVTAISAATSFTITAVQPGTPGSAETNDTSIVDYFIVREL